jgi:hypothetical protein
VHLPWTAVIDTATPMICSCNQQNNSTMACLLADPDYQAFLKQLEEGPSSQPSATAQLEAAEAEARQAAAAAAAASSGTECGASSSDTGVVTPLIAFLREKYGSGGALPKRGGRGGRRKEVPLLEVEEVGACNPASLAHYCCVHACSQCCMLHGRQCHVTCKVLLIAADGTSSLCCRFQALG